MVSNTVGLINAQNSARSVFNVFTAFVPLEFLALLGHTHPHAVIIQTLRLGEVANVKRDSLILQLGRVVTDAEVEPLLVPRGVRIDAHVQVILEVFHFGHHVQIATLEERVELQFVS